MTYTATKTKTKTERNPDGRTTNQNVTETDFRQLMMKNVDQLSYVSNSKCFPCMDTIPQFIRRQAENIPDKTLLTIYHEHKREGSITFGELYSQCRKFASALSSIGIKKGDIVVMCLRNCVDWLIIEYGICLLGAVPLNSEMLRDDFSDVQYVIEKSSAKALVFPGDNDKTVLYIAEMMKAVNPDKPSLQHAISVSSSHREGFLNYNDMMEAPGSMFDPDSVYIDMDDDALIMRSSGTTGRPKLVLHSHRSLLSLYTQMFHDEDYKGTVDDYIRFSNSNFGWLGGCPLVDIVLGGSGISYTGTNLPAHVDRILECARKENITMFVVTAPILNAIAKLPDLSDFPETIQVFGMGGAPIKAEWGKLLGHVPAAYVGYGCLEMCSISTKMYVKGEEVVANASGFATSGAEIKVCDDQMRLVDRGVMGGIYVRHQLRFLEYYVDDETTRKSVSKSNWYDTKDIGYIDHEGQLFVIGRRDHTITHGIVTTQCNEIENLVIHAAIPEIQDLVVVPVDDEIYGENNLYMVLLKGGVNIKEHDLKEKICDIFTNDNYKPHDLLFVDHLCYNENGKVDRKEMTKLAAAIRKAC